MMRRLLALMAGGEVSTNSQLADALGLRPGEADALLAQLASLGYVRDLPCTDRADKASGCDGCALSGACLGRSPGHVWTLTDKGRRAAAASLPDRDAIRSRSSTA